MGSGHDVTLSVCTTWPIREWHSMCMYVAALANLPPRRPGYCLDQIAKEELTPAKVQYPTYAESTQLSDEELTIYHQQLCANPFTRYLDPLHIFKHTKE